MTRFQNRNIIALHGYCSTSEPFLVVMELMLYGDLKGFLLKRRHLQPSDNNIPSDDMRRPQVGPVAKVGRSREKPRNDLLLSEGVEALLLCRVIVINIVRTSRSAHCKQIKNNQKRSTI